MATSNSKDRRATTLDFAATLPPTLYWDASFIINLVHEDGRWHKECLAFGVRLKVGDTLSYVSTLALDEAWFNLLQIMIDDEYGAKSFWRVINANPAIVSDYVDCLEQITNDIYDNPRIRVVSVDTRYPRQALKYMREFHFLPRDALHLAAMRQHKLKHIVTTDADFVSVTDISIFTCSPTLLSGSLAH